MASAAATASASVTASVATRSRVSPSRARRRVASRPSSASPSRKSVVASAISGPPRSSGPPPAALVVGHDAEETRATADAVSRALGVRVVCLLHDDTEATSRGGLCPSGSRLKCEPGPFPGCWRLVGGSAEDAAVCGADPTAGLVTSLGFSCVLCVVGIAREPCLGEDYSGAKTTRAGKRAAVVSGVPTIVACVPTTSNDAPVDGARDALEKVLQTMRSNDVFSREGPSNSPRSHFPFPQKDRWASLGTRAFPWPDENMAVSFMADARDGGDFAAKDCWSLGNSAEFFVGQASNDGDASDDASTRHTYDAKSLRRSLREAFRDGDVFVCVSAPPKWSKEKNGFAACRPGVLWRQERVAAEFGEPGSFRSETLALEDDRDRNRNRNENDAFGRTLPLNTLGDSLGCAGSGTGDARFVRQLATERLVAENGRYVASQNDEDERRDLYRAPPRGSAPSFFVVGGGVVVADECAGGDVDAVFRKGGGAAAVTTHQTWPAGHPFFMTQDAQLESLRSCGETGLPLWLAEEDE
jgi:hypothetical protein